MEAETKRKTDDELLAIQRIIRILEGLRPDRQGAVMAYLVDRYDINYTLHDSLKGKEGS